MRFLCDISTPIPGYVNQSYMPFGFWKFGLMCWVYDGYRGEVEWINSLKFVSEAKYADPAGVDYFFQKGVIFKVQLVPHVSVNLQDIVLNGIPFNPATGKGFPLILPE